MDRLTSMAVFRQAVDLGSFAAAARRFGMSPEMAGNHVRALEARPGVRLLNRSTRRLHLTEAGSLYYLRCRKILADIEATEAEASALNDTPRGRLRIAVPVTFGVRQIAPAVAAYMQRFPEVTFDVAVSDRFVHLIEEGFDLAIRIGLLPDSDLIARRLATAHLVVCAAPGYLERAGRPETPSDLSAHACLVYAETEEPDVWEFVGPDGRTVTVHVSGPLTATGAEFVHALGLAGQGVLRGPSFSFEDDIAAGRLVPLLSDWRSTRELVIHAVYPHRSLVSAKVRGFVDLLAARFASAADSQEATSVTG
jgi:DNA-binding transcriptional LysR family regulator